jgi:uridylate kinase
MAKAVKYRRILLKLSGEGLMGKRKHGLDPKMIARIAAEVARLVKSGTQVALVVGGGNIFRGAEGKELGIERATADYMGMLATVMNALAVQAVFRRTACKARVMSAIAMTPVCEPYTRRRALAHLEAGEVVIFAAGTGNPFFTTDTAAALRASEMGCDALFKGTQVDGVYSADPKKVRSAKRHDRLGYDEVLAGNLKVMDAAAVALARDNRIPIVVFSIHKPGALARVLAGTERHTVVN